MQTDLKEYIYGSKRQAFDVPSYWSTTFKDDLPFFFSAIDASVDGINEFHTSAISTI
jgi:hypothetical protein